MANPPQELRRLQNRNSKQFLDRQQILIARYHSIGATRESQFEKRMIGRIPTLGYGRWRFGYGYCLAVGQIVVQQFLALFR